MGLSTEQGVHIWRNRKSETLIIKVDGATYLYNDDDQRLMRLGSHRVVDMRGYKRIAVDQLSQLGLDKVFAAIAHRATGMVTLSPAVAAAPARLNPRYPR